MLVTEVFICAFWELYNIEKLNKRKSRRAQLKIRDKYGELFDPMCKRFLEYVIKETGAKIVITSTWRSDGLRVMQMMWRDRGMPGKVVGVTPNFMRRTGSTLQRGKEIDAYLKGKKALSYVIFDDDTDMEPHHKPRFVRTHFQYGITWKDACKAVKILNTPLKKKRD